MIAHSVPRYTCGLCDGKLLNGDNEWAAHVRSRRHRNNTRKTKRPKHNPPGTWILSVFRLPRTVLTVLPQYRRNV